METLTVGLQPTATQLFSCDDLKLIEKCPDPVTKTLALRVRKAAALQSAVLIIGQTGAGKDHVAKAIHGNSDRKDRELVNFNCANTNKELVGSEFFGHARGAFTGAVSDHPGFLEKANGSSLFLDEIGELSLDLQAKLLQVIETGRYNRVGETKTRDSQFRLIAATHRDLKNHVAKGTFREDLYFRLMNGVQINVPPLAERRMDIPFLATHFLRKQSGGGAVFSREALHKLCGYSWPGNIRELQGVIQKALLEAPELVRGAVQTIEQGHILLESDVLVKIENGATPSSYLEALEAFVRYCDGHSLRRILRDVEASLIVWALERAQNHQGKAAEFLDIPRTTLQSKVHQLLLQRSPDASYEGEEDRFPNESESKGT